MCVYDIWTKNNHCIEARKEKRTWAFECSFQEEGGGGGLQDVCEVSGQELPEERSIIEGMHKFNRNNKYSFFILLRKSM